MAEFGEKLRQAREKKGMTQQALAEQLYVTRQAVSRWERGARYPDLLTAKKLADILEVSVDELVSGEEKKEEGTAFSPLEAVLYALAGMTWLLKSAFLIGITAVWLPGLLTEGGAAYEQLTNIIIFLRPLQAAVITGALLYGLYCCMRPGRKNVRPGSMGLLYFLNMILSCVCSWAFLIAFWGAEAFHIDSWGAAILWHIWLLAGTVVIYGYFFRGRRRLIRLVCIVLILACLNEARMYGLSAWAIGGEGSYRIMNRIIDLAAGAGCILLTAYQIYRMEKIGQRLARD